MVPKVYLERIKYELDVIEKMGFSNYFLVVSDYVNYAKENGILVGPGRGSAAGSLVSYVLNITNIDPIRYQLLFERFLNPERVTMPDIDVDFLDSRRQEVIDYCVRKYGLKRTSGIITFGTLSSKQVVRDVFRTLNMDVSLLSKMLDAHLTLEENRKSNTKLNEYLNQNKDVLKAYTVALKLEGLKRHTSLHAAGVVISSVDLDEVVPLYYHDGMYLTCYSMNYLEDLGLLKMDFLGLKNLNIIDRILKDLKKDGICVDLDRIPFNDPMTLNIFTTVNTTGIFQFESEGMMNFLKKLKPNCFEDIYAALALYRPGPMGNIDTYIRRKKGEESYTCYPNLEEVLKPTYGILIYQEQIMQVANIMASYTFGEADILRRAMSKKKEDVLLKERDHFISNSIANGYSKEMAEEVYQFILKFASYGFNKAHSVAYGMISYQMAYLKAHYPAYFIRGLLDMAIGSSMATKNYLYEARMNHIRVLPPDINLSFDTYSLEDGSIRYPLYNIKGVGGAICSAILEERKNGKFLDIYDFIARTYSKTINKQVLMSLIMAGVFDSFGFSRHTLIFNMDAILNYAEVISYLDREYALKPVLEIQEEYPKRVLMEQEREVFGFYLTNHPITELRDKLKNNIRISALKNYFDQNVSFLASVKSKREIKTKKGDTMCFLSLEDEEGMISGVLFASTYQNSNPTVGKIYLIQAHIEKRFDEYQAVIRQINEMEI
jgi:DNA polymerase-3 subunit alpha